MAAVIGKRRTAISVFTAVFLALSAAAQLLVSGGHLKYYSKWILAAAVCGAALCLRAGTEDRRIGADCDAERIYSPSRKARIAGAAGLLAGSALLFLSSMRLTVAWNATYYSSFLLMAFGFLLASLGLDHLFGYTVLKRSMTRPARRREIVLLIAVMATAVLMRVYRLDYYPPPDGFGAIEEAQQGHRSYKMLASGETPWEFLFSNFVTALSFKLFGVGIFSLRIPAVLLSVCTVLLFYFLCRTLTDWRSALFAVFLFAVSRWHMSFSRISHNVFLPAPLVLLCVLLLYRTMVSSRPSLSLLAGGISGLLLYAYAPYRLMPVLVGIFFAERGARAFVRARRTSGERSVVRSLHPLLRNCRNPLLAMLGMLVLAVPLYAIVRPMPLAYFEAAHRAIARDFDPSWYDTSDMSLFLQRRVDRIRIASRVFTISSPLSWTFNIPNSPVLDPLAGIMALLGGAFCTVTFLRERHTFAVILLYVTLAMGFLFPHNLDLLRMITLIPQIYLAVCLLAYSLGEFFCRGRGNRANTIFSSIMIALCIPGLIINCAFFFGRQINDPQVRRAFRNEYTATCALMDKVPEGSFALVLSRGIENFFRPCDYEWHRGMEVPGAVLDDPENALAFADIVRARMEVTLIINSTYDLERLAAGVRKEFGGTAEERVSMELMNGEWEWAIFHIPRRSEGADERQLVEGYSSIEGEPGHIFVEDVAGRVRAWKSPDEGRPLRWKTAAAPRAAQTEFLFAGAGQAPGGAAKAILELNGRSSVKFDIADATKPARWTSGDCLLEAFPVRGFRGGAVFYRLTAPAGAIFPGRENDLSVTVIGGAGQFLLYERADCWDFGGRRWRGLE